MSDSNTTKDMTESDTSNSLLERIRKCVPSLAWNAHKGQAGRIGVVGGSLEYTGAPYFAAISALKTGADLVHVFCVQAAATVIKSYSPELIVHPLLDVEKPIDEIEPWLERLHVLVIGPGLGRDKLILTTVSQLIQKCRTLNKPLVIDADGLYLITQDTSLIQDYKGVILTPNKIEFQRLFGEEENEIEPNIKKLGNGITILEKGSSDIIYDSGTYEKFVCPTGGSGRRCGGQGDLLSGSLATFYFWALQHEDPNPAKVACFAASQLTKNCNRSAFATKGRSTVTTDMITYIHPVFEKLFEVRRTQTSV